MAITTDEINIKIHKELGPEELKKVNDFRSRQDTAVLVIMFTDLKGSTEIAERRGETFTNEMRRLHNQMLLEIIERDNRGIYIKNIGDSIMAVFSEPSIAVERALEIQKKLYDYNSSGLCEEPIIVRIGLHMGQVSVENNTSLDVFGRHVNRAARIESLADGGHIYLSSSVYENATGWIKDKKYEFVNHGEFEVKGISESVSIFEAYEKVITTPKAPSAPKSKPSWSKSSSNMVISEPLTEDRNNLLILLDKVKTFWIEGVLENSLYNKVMIELGKEYRPEEVSHPWESVLEIPTKKSETLSEDKNIIEVFHELNGYMLIIGEAGGGKTITLLQLAKELVKRAESDPFQPVPVVFNLSGYNKAVHKSLKDFLVYELQMKYQIPKKMSQQWIEDNRILPLLDGFDEVRKDHMESCLEAINSFKDNFGLRGLVVASRINEYRSIADRFKLNGAVYIKPLSDDDVDAYINKIGGLSSLKNLFAKDENLKELAKSPLMLNIILLTYEQFLNNYNETNKEISIEETRKILFDLYVKRMFERKGLQSSAYPKEKVTHWLSWLAGKMKEHSKTVFLLEELQPNWVDNSVMKWLSMRLPIILLLFIPVFPIVSYYGNLSGLWGFTGALLRTLVLNTGLMIIPTLILKLFKADNQEPAKTIFLEKMSFSFLNYKGYPKRSVRRYNEEMNKFFKLFLIHDYSSRKEKIVKASTITMFICNVLLLIVGNIVGMEDFRIFSFLYFIVLLLVPSIIVFQHKDSILIKLFNLITKATVKLYFWSMVSTSCFLLFSVTFWSGNGKEDLFLFIPVWIVFIFVFILEGFKKVVSKTTKPNEGVQFQINNIISLFLSLCVTIILSILIVWILFSYSLTEIIEVYYIYSNLIPKKIWVILAFCVIAYPLYMLLSHYFVRFLLYLKNDAPLNYVPFLDHACKLIFLQRVGGGYIFIHRFLLEYFADLGEAKRAGDKQKVLKVN